MSTVPESDNEVCKHIRTLPEESSIPKVERIIDIVDTADILKLIPVSGTSIIASGSVWGLQNFDLASKNAAAHGLWNDLLGTLDSSSGAITNLTLDTFDYSGFQRLHFQNNQNSFCSLSYQFPHGWNKSIVKPHLHLMPTAEVATNVTQSVEIGYAYAWAHNGNKLTPWVTGSASLLISASMYLTSQKLSLGDIDPGVDGRPSSILLMRIMRSGSSTSDSYDTNKPIASGSTIQANLALLYPDIHFQYARLGTIGEFSD